MSRFGDFDTFLTRKQHASDASNSAKKRELLEVRKKVDPLINNIFRATKEYHETIILPRKDSILILKKQEPTDTSLAFIYRANLIPTDFLPPAFRATDIIERVDYMNPKEITKNDWHANVALQVSVHLTLDNEEMKPFLQVTSVLWGKPDERASVLPTSISLQTDEEKRTPYTITTLTFSETNVERFVDEFEKLLMAVTPQILNHRQIVWKNS